MLSIKVPRKLWHLLKELKESYPIQVAEFAVARGFYQMPALLGGLVIL